ncbi:serine kinase [Aerococcus urinaehominis]|uniref:HPr kinase/phosphorylase n=1 Tax=Aerococcus urinaehominis TaxID=128944 RepID=A0A0X8FLI1_9LACT|nr:HPr(Ser) kinase/phosphatase [Aerococcus urinaehominis]AMB99432.1 serine kinase [Aerococcus urinaehominis]SDM29318.1 Hpr(Ser) kinase/phosphatase [Aerococcus urinaehominis]
MQNVTVSDLVTDLELKVISGEEFLNRPITTSDIQRPGLELTGYFNYYPAERVQLFGRTEYTYMNKMTSDERLLIMRRMSREETPCFIFSRHFQPEYEVIQAAGENQIPVLSGREATTQLSSSLTNYLQARLAERESVHGVFVEVYGLGILLTGSSGVGKSETALELIRNGHRLVADDRVDLFQRDENTLMGEAPAILQNMMEIRGLGIIDVMNLYGAGAVRQRQQLHMIIDLKRWEPGEKFDRLGNEPEMVDILGVRVNKITLPVQMGRNISNIVEVAAMNFRARSMGFDAAKAFEQRLSDLIAQNSGGDR